MKHKKTKEQTTREAVEIIDSYFARQINETEFENRIKEIVKEDARNIYKKDTYTATFLRLCSKGRIQEMERVLRMGSQ